jgi:hypothetical protein
VAADRASFNASHSSMRPAISACTKAKKSRISATRAPEGVSSPPSAATPDGARPSDLTSWSLCGSA